MGYKDLKRGGVARVIKQGLAGVSLPVGNGIHNFDRRYRENPCVKAGVDGNNRSLLQLLRPAAGRPNNKGGAASPNN